ncbi:hypothetical protein NPIL_438621 [Nephila pilipes]|uniref:Uncharacterized protein n=1 Tax=Nephila pilipes TaxID=299642 RepID=A0A8X6PIG9_NEPPI|nr:hypothetical protein NPIL_438621 [Nephila pilipes]
MAQGIACKTRKQMSFLSEVDLFLFLFGARKVQDRSFSHFMVLLSLPPLDFLSEFGPLMVYGTHVMNLLKCNQYCGSVFHEILAFNWISLSGRRFP